MDIAKPPRIERLAIVCEHEKAFKHQCAITNRFGEPVSFGKWCEDWSYVTFSELAKEFPVEMVGALIDAGVLDKDGRNPTVGWD